MAKSTPRKKALDALQKLSRLESGESVLEFESAEPAVLVETALKRFHAIAEESEIAVRSDVSSELPRGSVDKNLIDHDEYLLFMCGNLSYIYSEVDLSEDSIRLEGQSADGRTLQGQSEWLANFQIGFDHYATEQKFTVLVNYFDDRIFRISRGEFNGPEYEVSRVLIDLAYEKIFSDSFSIEASVKNLLNDKVEYSQNKATIESFETGTLIGVSLNYRF